MREHKLGGTPQAPLLVYKTKHYTYEVSRGYTWSERTSPTGTAVTTTTTISSNNYYPWAPRGGATRYCNSTTVPIDRLRLVLLSPDSSPSPPVSPITNYKRFPMRPWEKQLRSYPLVTSSRAYQPLPLLSSTDESFVFVSPHDETANDGPGS